MHPSGHKRAKHCDGDVNYTLSSSNAVLPEKVNAEETSSKNAIDPADVSASFGEDNSVFQISSEQGLTIGGKRLTQYEQVVLMNVNDKQVAPHVKSQMVNVSRGVKEGNKLDSLMNEKVNAGCSSPISFEEDQYYPPNMINHLDDNEPSESDGLQDLWKDMSIALECSKGETPTNISSLVQEEDKKIEECAHSFMIEDDLGLVCRVCGVIQKTIETTVNYQWTKGAWTTRTCMPGSRDHKLCDIAETFGTHVAEHFLNVAGISIHPIHKNKMKPHQIECFNFLVKNLLGDPPGGCILAHAPRFGKTFMLLSFIQSLMGKDPHARPLVVLPKGILATWRKEFQHWKVEQNILMYDFYSSKADNRLQQLKVLNKWQANRSILLLGYKQFANIICEGGSNMVTTACQDKLLKVPTLLILDEGHTPRNDNTDMVDSLAKVRTPCKVVLSGTLFQNHVGEVFNILKLVLPNFMKTETSRAIIKRILSRVHISSSRKLTKGNQDQESYFCDLVEETLRSNGNYNRKSSVIQDLRDMTRNVIHYYRGDFLDELPGLVDYTVCLNLCLKQKAVIEKLGKLNKFKKKSLEKAIYVHPKLMDIKQNVLGEKDSSINTHKLDAIIDSADVTDGAKAKFFLNLMKMVESLGEKVLVFSQYLLHLKFLERLIIRVKGWSPGKEIFVISGDTSPEDRELSMDQFNNSPNAKIFFGSIMACGEGISLMGASRVVILDVLLNPSVTRQAIGCAFRPGQQKKVYIYRLVAADSQDEEDHNTSFKKESISKMWFEWSGHYGVQEYELAAIDIRECEDTFFENPRLGEDVKVLYKR